MPENQDFSKLVKLLGMTGSANDAEALAFMRAANAQLVKLGWTWEKLLMQKVTIVEDPFQDAPVIPARNTSDRQRVIDLEEEVRLLRNQLRDAEYKSQYQRYQTPKAPPPTQGPSRWSAPRRQPKRKGKGSADGMTLNDLGL